MILAVEVGFIDREGVDQRLDLSGIAVQRGEVGGEAGVAPPRDALGEAALHEVALRLAVAHAGAAVQEGADAFEVAWAEQGLRLGAVHGSISIRRAAIASTGAT